jgi:hypothetical protein
LRATRKEEIVQPTDASLNPDLLEGIRTKMAQSFAEAGGALPPENIRLLRQRTREVAYKDEPVMHESLALVFVEPVLADGKLKLNPHVGLVKAVRLSPDSAWVIDHYTVRGARGLAVARAGLLQPDRILAYGVYSALPGARRAVLKVGDVEIDSDEFVDGAAIVMATLVQTADKAEVWLLDQNGNDFARYHLHTK